MPRGIATAIARWVLVVWGGTLALALVMLVPTILIVRGVASDVRAALANDDYLAAVEQARGLEIPADVCRLALLLPGAYSLQFVPGVGHWVQSANLVCDIAHDVGHGSDLSKVQAAVKLVADASLQDVRLDRKFVQSALSAAIEAEPYIERALGNVQRLNALALPGDIGTRVDNVATAWPPNRIQELQTLLDVAPNLLGFDQPRTYFVALQSEAEMRALGGFLGQYAIVRISAGIPQVLEVGTNINLQTPKEPGVKLLPNTEVLTLTNNPMAVNSNLAPHGPDVAKLWLNIWKQQTGQQLDGALALDVETAAQLVEAGGDVLTKPDGTRLTDAKAISDYAQNGVYFDFDGPDQAGDPRKAYQLAVFRDLLQRAAASVFTFDSMLRVLPTAFAEGRVLIHFRDRVLQEKIKDSPVAKDLRRQPNLLFVTWNNYSGNKFDYYIEPTGKLRCVADGMELRMQVFANADPKREYPAYIQQRLELPSETRPSVRDQWLLVMPRGSNVRWVSVDGNVAAHQVVQYAGRQVVQLILDTVAGERHEVRVGLGGLSNADLQIIGTAPVTTSC